MKRSFHIGIACACGAGIGTLIALSVGLMLWWLGPLIGALVGYIIIDFSEIPKKIRTAWLSTFTWWKSSANQKIAAHLLASSISLACWVGFTLVCYSFGKSLPEPSWGKLLLIFSTIGGGIGFFIQLLVVAVFVEPVRCDHTPWYESGLYFNCFSVSCYFIPKFLLEFGKNEVPSSAKKFGHFIGKVFRAIHSDVRVLCAVDSAIGTCIGYFCGHVFYGVAFGFLFGLLNYEIVSKRLPNDAKVHL